LLVGKAIALVESERANADWAIQRAFDDVAGLFAGMDDAYLRERGGDVGDLVGRLRMNLRGTAPAWQDVLSRDEGPFVLVADDPPPSIAAQMDWRLVAGLAIDAGSRTSHTAILARSLGIPTVVGLRTATTLVGPGRLVALDGSAGELLIEPTTDELTPLRRRLARRDSEAPPQLAPGPATTRDGVRIRLEANVDRLEDVPAALRAGAEGIGLFRSELLLIGAPLPGLEGPESEAVQADAYRRLIASFAPAPVTIRTFDLDIAQADALARPGGPGADRDPHRPLGVRGIRLGLARPGMLATQFRAILRAAGAGTVRVMLPFVTSAGEVAAARAIFDRCRAALAGEGLAVPDLPLGAMIEVPAAALTADIIGEQARFLAVGTNDLAQYLFAADRTDEGIAGVVEAAHPALLRVLRRLPRLAARRRVPLSVCGELASDPVVFGLLIGFGVREFSMTPSALPAARQVVDASSSAELKLLARDAVSRGDLGRIEAYIGGLGALQR
jgi:phosphotransferase system enzyme I (PtsI)